LRGTRILAATVLIGERVELVGWQTRDARPLRMGKIACARARRRRASDALVARAAENLGIDGGVRGHGGLMPIAAAHGQRTQSYQPLAQNPRHPGRARLSVPRQLPPPLPPLPLLPRLGFGSIGWVPFLDGGDGGFFAPVVIGRFLTASPATASVAMPMVSAAASARIAVVMFVRV